MLRQNIPYDTNLRLLSYSCVKYYKVSHHLALKPLIRPTNYNYYIQGGFLKRSCNYQMYSGFWGQVTMFTQRKRERNSLVMAIMVITRDLGLWYS